MIEHLIGIPYQNQGRDPLVGLDCWGLLRVFYRDVMGIDLPSYSDTYEDAFDRATTSMAIHNHNQQWVRVSEPRYGDAVLCRIRGLDCHVGVWLGNNEMLHTNAGHDSGIARTDSVNWQHRISGFYRHISYAGGSNA
jgi:cell wall-associated NlpC family hydrolase